MVGITNLSIFFFFFVSRNNSKLTVYNYCSSSYNTSTLFNCIFFLFTPFILEKKLLWCSINFSRNNNNKHKLKIFNFIFKSSSAIIYVIYSLKLYMTENLKQLSFKNSVIKSKLYKACVNLQEIDKSCNY